MNDLASKNAYARCSIGLEITQKLTHAHYVQVHTNAKPLLSDARLAAVPAVGDSRAKDARTGVARKKNSPGQRVITTTTERNIRILIINVLPHNTQTERKKK